MNVPVNAALSDFLIFNLRFQAMRLGKAGDKHAVKLDGEAKRPVHPMLRCSCGHVPSSPLSEYVEHVLFIRLVVKLAVDFRDFVAPSAPLSMLHIHDLIVGPVKIIGDEADFLVDSLGRISYERPSVTDKKSTSTSYS